MLCKLHDEYEAKAYMAGRDCAVNGPNQENCHFKHFARPELTAAWERGKRNAELEKRAP